MKYSIFFFIFLIFSFSICFAINGIVTEGGNTTMLNVVSVSGQTHHWFIVSGDISTSPSANLVVNSNDSFIELNLHMLPGASTSYLFVSLGSPSFNVEKLTAVDPSILDNYLGRNISDCDSATNTFTHLKNYSFNPFVKNVFTAYTYTYSNTPLFDVGVLRDSNSGTFVFVTTIKSKSKNFRNSTVDYQIILPTRYLMNETYYFSFFVPLSPPNEIIQKKTMTLKYIFNCSTGVFTVSSERNDARVPDVRLTLTETNVYPPIVSVQQSDLNGKAIFTITKNGTYNLQGTKTGYYEADKNGLILNLCPEEIQSTLENNTVNNTSVQNTTNVSYECYDNENCESYEVCTNHVCTEITGKCGYAENHTWIKYNCCSNNDCSETEKCSNHKCVGVVGKCGYVKNHTWVKYECCENIDCPGSKTCVDNRCVNITNNCELFGMNFGKYGLCWYWWFLLLLIFPIPYYTYKKYNKSKKRNK